jgi:hypothetical protein
MKKLFGLAIFVGTGLLIFACASDIVLPPAPSLVGYYEGTYTLKRGEGANADSMVQAITFRFDENDAFFMDADTSASGYDANVCFCKGRGTYAISDRVRLDPASDDPLPDNCDVCDPVDNPNGLFSLEQPDYGVKLSQVETSGDERVTKTLILNRVEETGK